MGLSDGYWQINAQIQQPLSGKSSFCVWNHFNTSASAFAYGLARWIYLPVCAELLQTAPRSTITQFPIVHRVLRRVTQLLKELRRNKGTGRLRRALKQTFGFTRALISLLRLVLWPRCFESLKPAAASLRQSKKRGNADLWREFDSSRYERHTQVSLITATMARVLSRCRGEPRGASSRQWQRPESEAAEWSRHSSANSISILFYAPHLFLLTCQIKVLAGRGPVLRIELDREPTYIIICNNDNVIPWNVVVSYVKALTWSQVIIEKLRHVSIRVSWQQVTWFHGPPLLYCTLCSCMRFLMHELTVQIDELLNKLTANGKHTDSSMCIQKVTREGEWWSTWAPTSRSIVLFRRTGHSLTRGPTLVKLFTWRGGEFPSESHLSSLYKPFETLSQSKACCWMSNLKPQLLFCGPRWALKPTSKHSVKKSVIMHN